MARRSALQGSTARAQNCAELTAEIDRAVATRAADEWAPIFDRTIWSGRPSAPTPRFSTILRPPPSALRARRSSEYSRCRVVNSPVEFGDTPTQPHRAAPELGQHTEEIALEIGLSWDEIARLKASGTWADTGLGGE